MVLDGEIILQAQARGIGHVVTFFACRKKAANIPNPVLRALCE